MHPTDLDEIYWKVIDLRYIISNIKNMDLQPCPLPPIFRKFNATYTKTPKGPSNNEQIGHPSRKKSRKSKGYKVQKKSTLCEWKLRDTKELIDLSGHKVQNQPGNACLQW